jgi:hypothetical protein
MFSSRLEVAVEKIDIPEEKSVKPTDWSKKRGRKKMERVENWIIRTMGKTCIMHELESYKWVLRDNGVKIIEKVIGKGFPKVTRNTFNNQYKLHVGKKPKSSAHLGVYIIKLLML